MANALTEIFGFAHTQSDDVQAKQTKKQFLANISKLLKTETVVIADRNNHQRLHRRDVADAAANKALTNHRVRKIALAFTVSKVAGNLVHNTCADRIAHRGERHQSLRADTETMAHEAVLSKFLTEFETFDPVMNGDSDGRYDDVIEVDPCLEAKPMLDLIVQRLTELMPDLVVPASKAMDAALEKALSYDPAIRKESKLGVGEVRYYAISVEADLCTLLERHFSNVADHLYHQLKSEGRIERRPHITLVHHKEVEGGDAEAKTTWHNAQQLSKRFGADAVVMQVQLGPRIAWNERVMAIEAHLVDPPDDVQGILRHRSTFHITIGTANREIPAVEGKWITQAMLAGQNKTEDGLAVISASVGSYVFQGRVRGMN